MTDRGCFGELHAQEFEVGDMVEWTTWNDAEKEWVSNYGILIKLENKLKSNRIVSIATVMSVNEPLQEIELFTVSLRTIKAAQL
jgi:hypothetical protein